MQFKVYTYKRESRYRLVQLRQFIINMNERQPGLPLSGGLQSPINQSIIFRRIWYCHRNVFIRHAWNLLSKNSMNSVVLTYGLE